MRNLKHKSIPEQVFELRNKCVKGSWIGDKEIIDPCNFMR